MVTLPPRVRQIALRLLAAGVLLVGIAVPASAATSYDLRAPGTSVTINGGLFEALGQKDPVQERLYVPFLEISSRESVTRGYNTGYRPHQFDETDIAVPLLLSSVPQVVAGGALYRAFYLNIQEPGGRGDKAYLSLDEVELYESPYADLCGYPFDGSGGGHQGCDGNETATLVWDLDAGEDVFLWLNAGNVRGSDRSDMQMLIPDSVFSQDQACDFGATGCAVYVTLYTGFGGDSAPLYGNDGRPEQWGVRVP